MSEYNAKDLKKGKEVPREDDTAMETTREEVMRCLDKMYDERNGGSWDGVQVPDHRMPPARQPALETRQLNADSHNIDDVLAAMCSNIERLFPDANTETTRKQKQALDWLFLLLSTVQRPDSNLNRRVFQRFLFNFDIRMFRRFFVVFDNLFFDGSLLKYCQVKLASPPKHWRGLCAPSCQPNGSRNCDIELVWPSELTLSELLGTLLHEMDHAALIIYSCHCRGCRTELREREGITGHGYPWQQLGLKIEHACIRCGLEGFVKGPIGRESSMALEIIERVKRCERRPNITRDDIESWTPVVEKLTGITVPEMVKMCLNLVLLADFCMRKLKNLQPAAAARDVK